MNKGSGFVFDLLAGVIIGFLIAPRPGEETREIISDKMVDIIDRTSDKASEVVNRVRSRSEETAAA